MNLIDFLGRHLQAIAGSNESSHARGTRTARSSSRTNLGLSCHSDCCCTISCLQDPVERRALVTESRAMSNLDIISTLLHLVGETQFLFSRRYPGHGRTGGGSARRLPCGSRQILPCPNWWKASSAGYLKTAFGCAWPWRCTVRSRNCSLRDSRTVLGTRRRVLPPPQTGTCLFSSGPARPVARGARQRAFVLQEEGTWRFFSGLRQTAVRGTGRHAPKLSKEGTWLLCSGLGKAIFRGSLGRVRKPHGEDTCTF